MLLRNNKHSDHFISLQFQWKSIHDSSIAAQILTLEFWKKHQYVSLLLCSSFLLYFFSFLSRITQIFYTHYFIKHTHTQRNASIWQTHRNSPRHTHPPQHQRESVMSVVEGVDTALSTNMLISYATETLHPSAVLEMGHNTATTKTHKTRW